MVGVRSVCLVSGQKRQHDPVSDGEEGTDLTYITETWLDVRRCWTFFVVVASNKRTGAVGKASSLCGYSAIYIGGIKGHTFSSINWMVENRM